MEPFTIAAIMIGIKAFEWLGKNVDTVVRTVELAWNTVYDWMCARRVSSSDVGSLVKQSLSNGKFKVVGGVFDSSGKLRQGTAWECATLDAALASKLSYGNEVRITL